MRTGEGQLFFDFRFFDFRILNPVFRISYSIFRCLYFGFRISLLFCTQVGNLNNHSGAIGLVGYRPNVKFKGHPKEAKVNAKREVSAALLAQLMNDLAEYAEHGRVVSARVVLVCVWLVCVG